MRSPANLAQTLELKELVRSLRIDEHLSIRKLLIEFAMTGRLSLKKDTNITCHIDISTKTNNEDKAAAVGDTLLRLVGITEREREHSIFCSQILKINTTGAFGVYCINNKTKRHRHLQGVLNLLLSGSKRWSFWPPAHLQDAQGDHFPLIITQEEGELMWIPPGWDHEVETFGYDPGITKSRDLPEAVNAINPGNVIYVAHSYAMWCMPAELNEYMLCSYGTGASVDRLTKPTPQQREDLYRLLVQQC